MPELPEVETIVKGLEEVLKGKIINSLECYYPGTVIFDANIKAKPFPAKVLELSRRGKYIIITLKRENTIIIHLRMTGKLVFDTLPSEPLKYERARIIMQNGKVLHFIDMRTFGKIIICKQQNLENYLPHMGIEPFSKDFNAIHLKAKLKGKKAAIKTVLLNQSIIAGLGNIYTCEILYRAGLNPLIPAGKLSHKEIVEIIQQTKAVLSEAISLGGTSISDYRNIDDKIGSYKNFLKVYQKQFCPIGHQVNRIKQAGRSTFFCPICQKKIKVDQLR